MNRDCWHCGKTFTADKRNNKIYCCRNHKEQAKRLRQEALVGRFQAKGNPLALQVWERDKGVCQICLLPISEELLYPSPFSFSVDHIIPRSKGGGHDISNLQATHLKCNIAKGNNG